MPPRGFELEATKSATEQACDILPPGAALFTLVWLDLILCPLKPTLLP